MTKYTLSNALIDITGGGFEGYLWLTGHWHQFTQASPMLYGTDLFAYLLFHAIILANILDKDIPLHT